jgi:hypothetical protein
MKEEAVKSNSLNYSSLLSRIYNQRIVSARDIKREERKSIAFLVDTGLAIEKTRKNPDEPTEEEIYYMLTLLGEDSYKKVK